MNRELLEFMMSISENQYRQFMDNTSLDSNVSGNHSLRTVDYSWIDIVEEYLPFLKSSVEKPYQELLDIEQSKQLYENRFLVSLIYRLEEFATIQYQTLLDRLSMPGQRTIELSGRTVLPDEDIDIQMVICSTRKENLDMKNSYGMTIQDRIERVIEVTNCILKTPFFESLKGTLLVTAPIEKTATILDDPNYRKLLELWEFLENYALLQKTFLSEELRNNLEEKSKQELYIPYFMNYQILKRLSDIAPLDEEFYKKYIENFIACLVEESTMDEKTFKKIVNKKFEEEYAKKGNRERNIQSIFDKSIINYQKQMKDAIRALKQ